MADEAGIDFLLPIGRWKGYGGDTDYQGATLETLTWASGLLASTKRITVFGTVHAPLFNPVIAAKEMRHRRPYRRGPLRPQPRGRLERGRVRDVRRRAARARGALRIAQEWIDVDQADLVGPKEDFDFEGQYLKLKGIRAQAQARMAARGR